MSELFVANVLQASMFLRNSICFGFKNFSVVSSISEPCGTCVKHVFPIKE